MASFSFNPKFHFPPYTDGRDLVAAGGPNGFNLRFDTIESDLKAAGTVIGQIGTAFDQLNPPVPVAPATVLATIAPTLLPVAAATGWSIQISGQAVAPANASPLGVVPLVLPDKVRLATIKVLGKGSPPTGVNTSVIVNQVPLSGATPGALVAFAIPKDAAFGTAVPFPAVQGSVVDLANFRYTISVGSGPGTGDPVTLNGFQITYTAP
ncbi:hypothetical protein [Actinomadura fibrosa]|uniref:Uncharacterized protein n=1 Tax=Actinomadura fibrosa TaxID=111802 RepID=A0ABW2XU71_9ACTN|nr:hypothetical protein [Actinomadura fibrosa]